MKQHEARFNARQKLALSYLSPSSKVEQVLFGGGVYGGKSWLGCYWHIIRRLKYPETRGLIGRAELKKLQLSTMLRFWELANEMGLRPREHYTYNGQLNIITWHNGSQTILMDMADTPSDRDFHRFGSLEITDYFIDEASEVSAKAIAILDTRVRYNLIGGIPKGLLTCNPSKGWLYNDFYDPHRKGKLPEHRMFVESLLRDNTIAPDPVYEAKMMRMPEDIRKRLLDGDWDYDGSKDSLFDYADLIRMFELPPTTGAMYVSADVAAMGDDMTIVGVWSGLCLTNVYSFIHKYPHEIAAEIRQICTRHSVPLANTVVDADGLGIGVKGILSCREFLNGSSAVDKDHYINMRSECYFKLSELVRLNRVTCMVHSERDEIIKQLDAIRRKGVDTEKKLAVVSREDIVRTLGYSPDTASMLMMRMFFELKPDLNKYAFGSF